MSLREVIINMIQEQIPITLFWAKVKDVNENEKTATIEQLQTQTEIEGVRIGLGDNYFVPAKDSLVLCAIVENEPAQVVILWTEKFEKIVISSEIIFNEGKNDGLVKINQLVSKLNKLEQELNDLKNIFAVWTPQAGDGGAVLKAAVSTWAAQKLSKTTKSELEDDKIKH